MRSVEPVTSRHHRSSHCRVLLRIWLSMCTCALGQERPSVGLSFEVASARHAAPLVESAGFIERVDPGRVRYRYVSMRYLLARAWNVKQYQISGPAWLDKDVYDINAKLPDGAGRASIPVMLQTLLEERFRVRVHYGESLTKAYALVASKDASKRLHSTSPHVEGGERHTLNSRSLIAKQTTVAALADTLSTLLDRAVVDMTGIQGEYDFTLDFAQEDPLSEVASGFTSPQNVHTAGNSIFVSLREYGLKLESRELPIKQLIVDSAQKDPTEN